jgi:hypothetical protein
MHDGPKVLQHSAKTIMYQTFCGSLRSPLFPLSYYFLIAGGSGVPDEFLTLHWSDRPFHSSGETKLGCCDARQFEI